MLTFLSTIAIQVMNGSVFTSCLLEAVLHFTMTVVFKQLRLYAYCLEASVLDSRTHWEWSSNTYNYIITVLSLWDWRVHWKLEMKISLKVLPFVQCIHLDMLEYTTQSLVKSNTQHVQINPQRAHLI